MLLPGFHLIHEGIPYLARIDGLPLVRQAVTKGDTMKNLHSSIRRKPADSFTYRDVTNLLDRYWASGINEIDGLMAVFFDKRIPDLEAMDRAEWLLEFLRLDDFVNTISRGTCPRCMTKNLYVRLWRGTWYCLSCSTGGGIVDLQIFMYPEKYSLDRWEPEEIRDLAARDILLETLEELGKGLEDFEGTGLPD